MTNLTIESSTLVLPKTLTPETKIRVSNLDRVHSPAGYVLYVCFYKPNGSANFFSVDILTEALSAALVPFYPLAGRLQSDGNGRPEIDCCGAGVLLVKSTADTRIDDYLDDSAPHPKLSELAYPKVEYAKDRPPLALFQVTFFQCGGVSLGVAFNHQIADGLGWVQFVNTWSELARGATPKVQHPSFDRTPLNARSPPTPTFPHREFQLPPALRSAQMKEETCDNEAANTLAVKIFHLSREKLDGWKAHEAAAAGRMVKHTTFETVAAHIWRCYCHAYDLASEQETMMNIAVDGRSRLRPPLPEGYCGNVVFNATCKLTAGQVMEKPLYWTATNIQEAVATMNDEYLRSAIDYLELEPTKQGVVLGSPNPFVVSWTKMPMYEADFGWGKPVLVSPGWSPEGLFHVLPTAANDGSLRLRAPMRADRLLVFERRLLTTN